MPSASYPGFMGPSYQSISYMADSERLINRYLERNESPSAPTPYVMLQCPGFALVATPANSTGRGLFSQNGQTWFMAGFQLCLLNSDDTITIVGTLAADANPATFMTNGDGGNQLGVTSGDHFYSVDLTSHVITTVLTSGATMCAFLDGTGYVLDAATSTIQATNFEDFSTMSGAVLQRTAGSDPWRAIYVVNKLMYALGERTSETLYDAGTAPFALAPIQEGFMQQGIAAPFSGARLDTALVWLSHNDQGRGQIVSASGYTPGRVSTHAVEASIQSYDTIDDAVAFSYQENGHPTSVMTFQNAGRTWAFDQATGLFHERLYWDTTNAEWLAYRPMFACSDTSRVLVQDRLTAAIYRIGTDLFTDVDGAAIRRLRQPPRLSFDQKRFTVPSIELVMDRGQGTQTGQGYDPQMIRQTSRDGGQTWGAEQWASTGKIGAFDTRVRWTQCGQARNRVDRFIDTDPVPSRIADCIIDVNVGPS